MPRPRRCRRKPPPPASWKTWKPASAGPKPFSRNCLDRRALRPRLAELGREDIEFVTLLGIVVGAEDQRLAIGRKLRERREPAETGHLLQTGAIHIDGV